MWRKTLEELTPKGAEDVVQWAKVKEGFGKMDEWIGASGEGSAYIMGNAPCYADMWIAGYIVWIKLILPAKWEAMKSDLHESSSMDKIPRDGKEAPAWNMSRDARGTSGLDLGLSIGINECSHLPNLAYGSSNGGKVLSRVVGDNKTALDLLNQMD
ncbi:hypothetical protein B0H17DRAFT_1131029 [Mycena rosella]|uniref:Glutathione S-transferase UstS-like C-terminal domain-containing protein n=1 Tax=Mycena rosella TaxID=1033263 RepID=A0AAD7DR40_MYCRO|nr:hypothetical protein B0H17DRAFT_1131029 [Mycena rosella]